MIDLTVNRQGLAHNSETAWERGIIIPTVAQMRDPSKIPEAILGCGTCRGGYA